MVGDLCMRALLAPVSLIIGVLMRVCACLCFYIASICVTSRLHICLRGYVCRIPARMRVEVCLCVYPDTLVPQTDYVWAFVACIHVGPKTDYV